MHGTSPMDARQYAVLPDPFPMWRGGVLHGARIAYETWGELNAQRDNAVLLFTGLSPPAHARSSAADPSEGWWEGMIGPQLAIDTSRLYVICVNSLGSCRSAGRRSHSTSGCSRMRGWWSTGRSAGSGSIR